MIRIYHNPRCAKSREGLALLEASGRPFETILYMDQGLSATELKKLLSLLDIKPQELIRKNEKTWKEKYKGKHLTDNQAIKAMALHPNLMERPVVACGNKAVIGRPATKIRTFLEL
jgi:arsenate reductase